MLVYVGTILKDRVSCFILEKGPEFVHLLHDDGASKTIAML